MAVVFKSFNNGTGTQEEIGVYRNGRFTGKATLEIQIRLLNLEDQDNPEEVLVNQYDSYAIQAVKVPDDSISIEDFDRDYGDADIDPEDYV